MSEDNKVKFNGLTDGGGIQFLDGPLDHRFYCVSCGKKHYVNSMQESMRNMCDQCDIRRLMNDHDIDSLHDLRLALEDGEALLKMGFSDEDQHHVEELHDYLVNN